MKKLFTIMFLLSLCTVAILQARETQYENKGTAIIHKGVVVNGNQVLMDNAYKQHMLLKKANQWLVKKYDNETVKIVDETIVVSNDEYKLLLEFTDGGFTYVFTSTIKGLEMKQQKIIDYLVQYVRTCKLENNSW